MDRRTTNFSQKGFSGNFLALMKKLERNELCCLDFLTKVYTINTDDIVLSGTGTESDPLTAKLVTPGGGGIGTVNNAINGVHLDPADTVKLGGVLTELTTITGPTSTQKVIFTGLSDSNSGDHTDGFVQVITTSNNFGVALGISGGLTEYGIYIDGTDTGIQVSSAATFGGNFNGNTYGVLGQSANIGGFFNGNNYGIRASSQNGTGGYIINLSNSLPTLLVERQNSTGGGVTQNVVIFREITNAVVSNNRASTIDIQPPLPGSVMANATRIVAKWTNVVSPTSQTEIWGYNANVATQLLTIQGDSNGRVGIGSTVTSPTAHLHLPAGTATANTAPLKLITGTLLTTPEDGAIEYASSHLYFTIGSTRTQIDNPYTFVNGLTNTTGTVRLGGTLTQNTTIDTTASFGLTITGANTAITTTISNTSSLGTALFLTAPGGTFYAQSTGGSGSGTAVFVESTSALATTPTLLGRTATASSNTAVRGETRGTGPSLEGLILNAGGLGLKVYHSLTSNLNTILTSAAFNHEGSGASFGASGIGTRLSFGASTSTTIPAVEGGTISWNWVNAAHTGRTGQFDFALVNNAAAIATVASLKANGDATFVGFVNSSTGLTVKEGSNAKQGVATLVAGTVTVSNTSITANSRIFLTGQDDNGGTVGFLRISARVVGTSFTITSSSLGDSSIVAYEIFEPGS